MSPSYYNLLSNIRIPTLAHLFGPLTPLLNFRDFCCSSFLPDPFPYSFFVLDGLRGSSTIIIITRQPFIVIYENLIWGLSLYSTPSYTFNCTQWFYWIWRLNGFSSCFWLSDYTPRDCCWRLASRTGIWDFNYLDCSACLELINYRAN